MKKLIIVMTLILCSSCSTKKITDQTIFEQAVNQSVTESGIEEKYGQLLLEGYNKLTSKYTKESIDKYFNPIIEAFNSNYGNDGMRVYCSRWQSETLFYLLQAAEKNEEAVVISPLWSDAFYLKGYANLDLGNIEDAKTFIKKAIELSPSNSMYLSELGHIYQVERNWIEAMELYKRAEESANEFSPENLKNNELTRAMRGIGYCLIELGRFDEAEEIYRKCLAIDKKDERALNELKYIQGLRNK